MFSSSISTNDYENEDKKLPSRSERISSDNNPNAIKLKQQSSSSDLLIRGSIPSTPIPKLLPKRSSIKQTSINEQLIKPIKSLSITDVSTSSNNTITTDHLPSTHSTISNQQEIVSLKKTNKRNNSNDKFITTSHSVLKRNILRKTLRPSQNQSSIFSNKKEQHVITTKKQFKNNNLLTTSQLASNVESGSEAWIKSHEDNSQQAKKMSKNRIVDESRSIPFNLKSRSDQQAYTIDSSKCIFIYFSLS